MDKIQVDGIQVNHTQSPKSQLSRYIRFFPVYRVHTIDCSGQNYCSGQGIDECSWENHITGAVFRAKRGSKPTSIQRVAPVGQGTGQATGREDFYQDSEKESEMTHWRLIERDTDGI